MDISPVMYKMEEFVKELQSKTVNSVVGHMGHKHTHLQYNHHKCIIIVIVSLNIKWTVGRVLFEHNNFQDLWISVIP